jgi:DHA1 family tetracycline resistance protein-like MFS transporter
MSRQVSGSEQGELQGALASIGSLTSIFAPLMLTNLFWYFTSPFAPTYLPGAPFVAASLFCVGALLIFAAAQKRARSSAEPETA